MRDAGWDGCHGARLQPPTQRLWRESGRSRQQGRSGPKTCAIPGQCSSGRNEKMGSTHLAGRGLPLARGACLRHREGSPGSATATTAPAATTMHCLVQSARERQGRAVFPCVWLHCPCVLRHLRHCYREVAVQNEPIHSTRFRNEDPNPNGSNRRSPASAGAQAGAKSSSAEWTGRRPPFCADPT